MTKLKTNCLNYVWGIGKVVSIEHIEHNGRPLSRFFLDYGTGMVSVMHYNAIPGIQNLKNGDSVFVEGKLRHSTRSNAYKIMAEIVVLSDSATSMVVVVLEGAPVSLESQENALVIQFEHIHATKEGRGYKCPIQVSFKKTAEAAIMSRYIPGDTQVILGRLRGTVIQGANMTSSTPIYITIPEATNGTEK